MTRLRCSATGQAADEVGGSSCSGHEQLQQAGPPGGGSSHWLQQYRTKKISEWSDDYHFASRLHGFCHITAIA